MLKIALAGALASVACPALAQSAYDHACPLRKDLDASQFSNEVARAIFQVRVKDARGATTGNGTATLIDRRGYYMTAGHVVDGYLKLPTDKAMLVRYDGKSVEVTLVANFLNDGVDVAILKSDTVLSNVVPVNLRISSPLGSGALRRGTVLAYTNGQDAISLPIDFTIGGTSGNINSMTLGFAAQGGNSGALLLEPNGRAFALLKQGPDPAAMQMSFYVPSVPIPGRRGNLALPEMELTILPEDVQAAVSAASLSKALPVSAFWDRLAATIPPSPAVDAVISEIRTRGWKAALPDIVGGSDALTAVDIVHFYRRVASDDALLLSAAASMDQLFNVVAETCSADAVAYFIGKRLLGVGARRAAANIGTKSEDIQERAIASALLTSATRYYALATGRGKADTTTLRDVISDLALVEFNRVNLGESSTSRLISVVSIAEGLGGTATTGEIAGLTASRNGDKTSGAAFLVLADERLRALVTPASGVEVRRGNLSRIYGKVLGRSISLRIMTPDEARTVLGQRRIQSPVTATLTSKTSVDAVIAATALQY